jgi:hypothetical protein
VISGVIDRSAPTVFKWTIEASFRKAVDHMFPSDVVVVEFSEPINCAYLKLSASTEVRTFEQGDNELSFKCTPDILKISVLESIFPQEPSLLDVSIKSLRDLAGNELEFPFTFSIAVANGADGDEGEKLQEKIASASKSNYAEELKRLSSALNSAEAERARLEVKVGELEADLAASRMALASKTANESSAVVSQKPRPENVTGSGLSDDIITEVKNSRLDLQEVIESLSKLHDGILTLESDHEKSQNATRIVEGMLAFHMKSSSTVITAPASRSTSSSDSSDNSSLVYVLYASMGISLVGFATLFVFIRRVKNQHSIHHLNPASSGHGNENRKMLIQNPVYQAGGRADKRLLKNIEQESTTV